MIFSRFKEIGNVTLIHDSDLEKTLIKLNKLDKLKSGKLKCKFTKVTMTLDNLHVFFYENNDLKFVSNSIDAKKEFSKYLNAKES